MIEEPGQDLLKPRGGARLHAHLGLEAQARARVGGEGPAAEVGEGGSGGAGEDVAAVGRWEGQAGGLGHAGEGVRGPARRRVVDAAAAPLEHEGQRGEREREDRKEQEQAAPPPGGACAGGIAKRRSAEHRLMWWGFRSFPPFLGTFNLGAIRFLLPVIAILRSTIYTSIINGSIFYTVVCYRILLPVIVILCII